MRKQRCTFDRPVQHPTRKAGHIHEGANTFTFIYSSAFGTLNHHHNASSLPSLSLYPSRPLHLSLTMIDSYLYFKVARVNTSDENGQEGRLDIAEHSTQTLNSKSTQPPLLIKHVTHESTRTNLSPWPFSTSDLTTHVPGKVPYAEHSLRVQQLLVDAPHRRARTTATSSDPAVSAHTTSQFQHHVSVITAAIADASSYRVRS